MNRSTEDYVKIKLGNRRLYLSNAHNASKASGTQRKSGKYSFGKGNIPRVDIRGLFHGGENDSPAKSLPGWTKAADQIEALFKSSEQKGNRKHKVWLHCSHGKSRTAYIATTYLMRHQKYTYERAKKDTLSTMEPLHGGKFNPDIKGVGDISYDSWASNNRDFIKNKTSNVNVLVKGHSRSSASSWQSFSPVQPWFANKQNDFHWQIESKPAPPSSSDREKPPKPLVGLSSPKGIIKPTKVRKQRARQRNYRRLPQKRIDLLMREARKFIGDDRLPAHLRSIDN